MACDTPFYVRSKDGFSDIPVPCGRCPNCKKRRVDSWVFRLMQEDKVSMSAHFVTLTYDSAHVPISPNGFMTLTRGFVMDGNRKIDMCCFTKYMKRLRKLCPGVKLKYYAVGEYGTINRRPHWHAIIFNVPNERLFFDAWSLNGVNFGSVHVGQVSGDSVAYTTKYIDKPGGTSKKFYRDDRIPEFSLMSKGLGLSYITSATRAYHSADVSRMCLVKEGGYRIAMPRYYRDRIFGDLTQVQHDYIFEAMQKRDAENRDLYYKVVANPDAFTYGDFLTSQRRARINSFYSNQKKRDV